MTDALYQVPAGQAVQDAAVALENRPEGQFVQLAEPEAAKVPAAQGDAVGEVEPAGQKNLQSAHACAHTHDRSEAS